MQISQLQQWVLTVKKCLVAVHMDSGYIHVEALRSLNAADITAAYEAMLDFFRQRLGTVEDPPAGSPMPQRLQPPCSGPASPKGTCGNHRTLAAGRSVRTWKNHFIASWATADVACPPPLWATTIEHCELTLNLCRPSYRNQSISAWQSSTGNDTHSTPDPWAPWDVRFRCSSLQQTLLVSAL
jgi:hypothetical protein